jgi:hypothetical protein
VSAHPLSHDALRRDVVDEALRILAAADLPLRLLGGAAIRLHATEVPEALDRRHEDIDLVTTSDAGPATARLLTDLGYEPNERFNALNGHRRQVFYDHANGRHVDVFVGEFAMCHRLSLEERLLVDSPTLPLADLLLTKLQVVEVNRKDLGDVALLLLGHEIADHDDDAVNAEHVAGLLAADWGLWRTATGTLATLATRLGAMRLTSEQSRTIERRIEQLLARVQQRPKSLRWRARARVGERVRWYEEPEEIGHAEHR